MTLLLKLRPRTDFTSNLVRLLAFGTPKFYIAPYGKINRELINMSSSCDAKSDPSVPITNPRIPQDYHSRSVHYVLHCGTSLQKNSVRCVLYCGASLKAERNAATKK